MNLLVHAANSWTKLMTYQYNIIGAKKGTLHPLLLSFNADEFFHLAGFHYLKDIVLPSTYAKRDFLQLTIDEKITLEQIEKSSSYSVNIEPRLIALSALENLLDTDFTLYKFDPVKVYSSIDADYLISGTINVGNVTFVFLGRDNDKCFCRSTFLQSPKNDLSRNQTRLSVLHKSKINTINNESHVFIDKMKRE